MNNFLKSILFIESILLSFYACTSATKDQPATTKDPKPLIPSLKDTFKNDFLIGAAINHKQLNGEDKGGLKSLKKNSIL